ncbi:three-helix bundle dimerization domain-containing protein [Pseudonocardia sp. DLS-67]
MTPPTGSAPERSNSSSRWAQPVPRRTDENLKHVHRKIDRNLKSGAPLVDNGPLLDPESRQPRLPGAPSLLAGLGRLTASGPAAKAPAAPRDGDEDEDDFLARANAERLAKQWEDVTARLLRDLAPNGGADADRVLHHIAEQREGLDSATVRDYLPVLVDKAVRRLLDPEETGSRG